MCQYYRLGLAAQHSLITFMMIRLIARDKALTSVAAIMV
jgi:hypothetical protein